MSQYPLNLSRLEWAQRIEVVKSLREAKNEQGAAFLLGCTSSLLTSMITKFKIRQAEWRDPEIEDTKLLKPFTELERMAICATMRHTQSNKSRTAEILGVSRQTLDNKIKYYNIEQREIARST